MEVPGQLPGRRAWPDGAHVLDVLLGPLPEGDDERKLTRRHRIVRTMAGSRAAFQAVNETPGLRKATVERLGQLAVARSIRADASSCGRGASRSLGSDETLVVVRVLCGGGDRDGRSSKAP